jgi:hypothetical protein
MNEAKKIAALIKAGDRKAAQVLIEKMNASTTRKHEQFKAGTWW